MNVGDRVFGLITLGLSVWLIMEARRYDYVTEFTPGPGFAPLWIGIILGLFSLFLIYHSLTRKEKKDDVPILPPRSSLVRVGYIVLILAVFTVLVMSLGFLLATWGFVFVLLYFLEDYSILKSVSYSMLFSALSFFVFRYWMEVDLPKGWFGF